MAARKRKEPVRDILTHPTQTPRDPRICGACTHGHGTPGTKCERHGKYIEKLPDLSPLDQAVADARELVARDSPDAVEAFDTMVEMMRDNFAEIVEAASSDGEAETHEQIVAHIKLLEERSKEWCDLCDEVDVKPDDVSSGDLRAKIDAAAEESPAVAERDELLSILGLSEHAWEMITEADKRALRKKMEG